MKKLFITMCLVALSAFMLSASTLAWFSMNRHVSATGMKVQAKASSSLVIANGLPVGTNVTVNFTTDAIQIAPATHSDGESVVNLKYLPGSAVVDAYTGFEEATTFVECLEENASSAERHYFDYNIYVAAAGDALTNQKFTLKFNAATITAFQNMLIAGGRDTTQSLKVAVYSQLVSATGTATTYIGTLSATDPLHSLTWDVASVPKNSTGSAILITLRAYFDGAERRHYVKASGTFDGEVTYYTYNSTSGQFEAVGDPQPGSIGSYYTDAASTLDKYVKADKFVSSGVQYFTKTTIDSVDNYTLVGSPVIEDLGNYYVKVMCNTCYVYSDLINTSDASFAVEIDSVNQPA